ncbi:MAG: hypothetical protein RR075_00120 [Pygmaiobacter sp.]
MLNTIFVIVITGFAVLGAYFVAELFCESEQGAYQGHALVLLCEQVSVPATVGVALALRETLPRSEILAVSAEANAVLPFVCEGLGAITFVSRAEMDAVLAAVHLQSGENTL